MIKRIIPIVVLQFFAVLIFAQTPYSISFDGKAAPRSLKELKCNNAGTATVSLGAGVQSNDPVYLCFGDSLFIDHQGGQDLAGDPVPATPPGIGYAFYKNAPTVPGQTLSAILSDPSVLNIPPAPGGLWVATGKTPSGDMYFKNNGSLQLLFNGGKPVQIWFAPITLDDWANKKFEGTPAGNCVDVNINNAFPVVYLNKITYANFTSTTGMGGSFQGTFIVKGGLPEYLGAQNYTINIYLKANPAIKGNITSGPAKHGSSVSYNVPQGGTYVIEISDGKTCEFKSEVQFPAVTYTIGQGLGYKNDTVCIDITVDNWEKVVGQTLYFFYDTNVLEYVSGKFVSDFNNSTILFNENTKGEVINLFVASDTDNGYTLPDGSKLFELCFKLIGNPLDCSKIYIDELSPTEVPNTSVTDGSFNYTDAPQNFIEGEICILPQNTGLQVATTVVQPICNGSTDGSIQLVTLGGKAPYTYNWVKVGSPGVNGNGNIPTLGGAGIINGLASGIYTITVTDNSQPIETQTLTIQVQQPGVITPQFNIQQPTCHDANDGFIDVILTNGGTQPYSYSWSTGLNGPNATSLSNIGNGSYKLTITDSNQCTAEFTNVLNKAEVIVSLASKQDIGCGGTGKGSATLDITGGVAPYDFLWNDGNISGPTRTDLDAGNYSVTVTDVEGCSNTLNVTIIQVSGITITGFDSVSVKCGEDSNGQLTVKTNIPTGSTIVSYSWSGPSATTNTATITNLKSGKYFVTITDNNGCAAIDSATLWSPAPISLLNKTLVSPKCFGDKNGSIAVQMSGGTPPYSYTWSTNPGVPTSQAVIASLGAGTYYVSVTDAKNCGPYIETIVLNDPPKITLQFLNIAAPTCATGTCTGTAFADALYSDGNPGTFKFVWESAEIFTGVNASVALQLCSGWQSVTVTDNNCGIIDSVLIPAAQEIEIIPAEIKNTTCNGLTDGSITVNLNGGVAPYTYNWSTGTSTTNILGNLAPGTYQLTITDAKGCSSISIPYIINEPPVLQAQLDPNITHGITCSSDSDGEIQVFFTGGNSGVTTYTWSPNVSTTEYAGNLGAGIYSVTVTDAKGCTDSVSYTIQPPSPLTAVIPTPEEPECNGFQTFVTVTSAAGGSGPDYTFSVDNGPALPIGQLVSIFAGDHLITVFDKKGCYIDEVVSISEPAPVSVNLGPDIEVELGDSIQLNPQGLPSNMATITWTPAEAFNNPNTLNPYIYPTEPIEVKLTITDDKGCIGSDVLFIDVDNNRNVYIPNAFSPDADGINDVFRVGTGTGVVKINYMKIFDRWGALLYEAKDIPAGDYTTGWDGKVNGQRLNPCVVVYIIEVEFLDGVKLLYRGEINIIR